VQRLRKAMAAGDTGCACRALASIVIRVLWPIVEAFTSIPEALLVCLAALSLNAIWKNLVGLLSTGNTIAVYRLYTATYSFMYLCCNFRLGILIIVAGRGLANFETQILRYRRLFKQLNVHTPAVIARFSGDLKGMLLPPLAAVSSDIVLQLFLPSTSWTVAETPGFMLIMLLFFAYGIVSIDVSYLVQAWNTQQQLCENPAQELDAVKQSLEEIEETLTWIDSGRYYLLGSTVQWIRKRYLGPLMHRALADIVGKSLNEDLEREIATYMNRVLFNIGIVLVFLFTQFS